MRYKVYAGTVETFENRNGQWAVFSNRMRFRWTKKVLVYNSCGDSVEGEETEGVLIEPLVELENKSAGVFTCRVPYKIETRFGTLKNPYYDSFVMGQTWVMVEEDSECIFFGKVTEYEREFNLDKSISADGILKELEKMQTRLEADSYTNLGLLDRTMRANKSDKGDSPVNCMEKGNVTVESRSIDTTETGDQFGSFWSILSTYVLDKDEGYLRLRLANDPGTANYFFYYDYLKEEDVPKTGQTIEYGVNMLDFTWNEKLSSDMVNSVTAHGIQTTKKGWWIFAKTTYDVITATCSDTFSINNYGLISRNIYVDGKANTEDSLYEAASKELKNYKQSAEPTLTVKSFDRRDAGETVEKLGYLLRTHILSEPHDIDRWMVCTKVKLPLDGPNSKEFTFGLTSKKLSKRVTSIFDAVSSIITGVKGLIGHINEVSTG